VLRAGWRRVEIELLQTGGCYPVVGDMVVDLKSQCGLSLALSLGCTHKYHNDELVFGGNVGWVGYACCRRGVCIISGRAKRFQLYHGVDADTRRTLLDYSTRQFRVDPGKRLSSCFLGLGVSLSRGFARPHAGGEALGANDEKALCVASAE
jgi:hypothetical protein